MPASPESVVAFLQESQPLARQDLYEAIGYTHEQIYWHTGAYPHCTLWIGFGFKILDDGSMAVRDDARRKFAERFD